MQQRESAKKAAASAAAANASSSGSPPGMVQGVPVAILGTGAHGVSDSQLQATAVTQAASWLDRANAILKGSIVNEVGLVPSRSRQREESTQSSAEDSLENQMKEVQRLIFEGPVIQQAAAGLPHLLIQTQTSDQEQNFAIATTQALASSPTSAAATATTEPASPDLEPKDKRMRTSNNTTGAEDAEALVGFLRSVRASAAAGQDL
jgi:hypothetical protein